MMSSPVEKLKQVTIEALMSRGMTRGEATTAVDKLANAKGAGGEKPRTYSNGFSAFTRPEKTFTITNFEELNETANARLFLINDEEIWLPKSQIVSYAPGKLVVTLWIAKKKGLTKQTCY
jgi:hypothetical protein